MINVDLAKKVKEKIYGSSNIHVYTHAYPDGDAISSLAAIDYFLSAIEKKHVLRCDTPLAPMFKWFKLNVENKRNIPAPDTIITLDFGQLHQMGSLYNYVRKDFTDIPIINIDHHHLTNEMFGVFNIVENSASTTEVIQDLLRMWSFPIDEKLAFILLYGIVSDTFHFQKSNTNSQTLFKAAELAQIGADPTIVAQKIHKTKTTSSLKLWGTVLSSLKLFHNDELAVGTLSAEMLEKYNVEEYAANLDGLVNFMTAVNSSKITVLLKQRNTEVRISFRSDIFFDEDNNKNMIINVSRIAQLFGGGGHISASGCSIKASLSEAEEKIVQACVLALDSNQFVETVE